MTAWKIALFTLAAAALRKQNPVNSAGGLDMDPNDPDRMVDSFGRSTLEPPCSKIDCGETACPDPFVLKTDSTCCGVCYAPDHVVAIDRHVAGSDAGYRAEMCEGAPSSCLGPGPTAVCFKPSCAAGFAPSCSPGSCCATCSPDGSR